jgi:hypothetical protein
MGKPEFISINFILYILYMTTNIVEPLTAIKGGNSTLYKSTEAANNYSCCSGNKSYYRYSQSGIAAANGRVLPFIVGMQPPNSTYIAYFKWAENSNNGNVIAFAGYIQVNQQTNGGTINAPTPSYSIVSQSQLGNTVGISPNNANNSFQIVLNDAASGGTVSYVFELEIFANKLF